MRETTTPQAFRITLQCRVCRSSFALLMLNIGGLRQVAAVTAIGDDALVVVAADCAEIHDALLSTVVDSGFDPSVVTVVELERVVDPNGQSVEDALRLGLIEPMQDPVRARTVQRVVVRVADGYDPDTLLVSAGIPTEMAFSEGHGCVGRVVFDSLGIEADLENGGALVKLLALEAGTYPFRCGRDVVRGTVVAE